MCLSVALDRWLGTCYSFVTELFYLLFTERAESNAYFSSIKSQVRFFGKILLPERVAWRVRASKVLMSFLLTNMQALEALLCCELKGSDVLNGSNSDYSLGFL